MGNRLGDDMAEVELQEIDISHHRSVSMRTTNLDEDKKDESNEEKERSEERKYKTSTSRCSDGRRGKV